MEFDCAEYYNLMGIEYPLNYQLNETYVLQAEVCGGSKGRIYIDENGKILPINNKSDKFIVIDDIEKDTFLSNLESMKEYKIQRATNKIFYFYCIESIVKIIATNKIKKIELPFNGNFLHVLKSIQNKLSTQKINSSLKVEEENDIYKIKFSINLY